MRLAGQIRLGFFPAHPDTIAHVAARLVAPAGPWSLLDPCAGEGAAVAQLASLLGCDPAHVHAVELEEDRAATLKAALPQGRVLAPASIHGVGVQNGSISLLYLNPPFDHQYAGGRVEVEFLQRATPWLAAGGILVLICPDHVAEDWDTQRQLKQWYDNFTVVPFPEGTSPYGEVAILAVKRKEPEPYRRDEDAQAPEGFTYRIPSGKPPAVFFKKEPTEAELRKALAQSPLRKLLAAPAPRQVASPPLALGNGHVALLLASGYLDGVVRAPGELPHVVRGTARKQQYVHDTEEILDKDGEVTGTKTILRERIQLVVRCVDAAGNLKTFKEDQEEKANGN